MYYCSHGFSGGVFSDFPEDLKESRKKTGQFIPYHTNSCNLGYNVWQDIRKKETRQDKTSLLSVQEENPYVKHKLGQEM